MLAMPGPIAAAWMSINGLLKNEIRATIISFFVFAYGVNAAWFIFFIFKIQILETLSQRGAMSCFQ